jgi:2,4-dienoyl-CoA reductase-like NADH-dependent reductase (Old Yellow Enzyme family)
MTTDEVKRAIEAYVEAAVRCEKAGFDGVELHGAHGYLLCSFLDDRNQREDGYGGDWASRTRAFHEAIDGVRAATRPDFQLGVRLSPERFGYSTTNAMALAQDLMTGGRIDYLDMSLWDCFKQPVDESLAEKPLIDWFTGLERGTCKLGVAGKITSAAGAQACLDHGADFVLIGRAAILHHDFPRRALADAAFDWCGFPVSRAYLESESVGPAFREYMATQWKNYVSD